MEKDHFSAASSVYEEHNKKVILKKDKEQSVKRYHPWIFSGAIRKITGNPVEGDIVEVFSAQEEFLALGHFQIGSIAVRIFSFHQVKPDLDFWHKKIETAFRLRLLIGLADNSQTTVYRLVNGEGDNMPGLVIDYYNGIAVMQTHSVGMYRMRHQLGHILKKLYGNKLTAVYDKSEATIPVKAGLEVKNEFLWGNLSRVTVTENNFNFFVDVAEGQKTGFFIDQRDNRKLLSNYCNGKNVLNVFCYTGGFSVYAALNHANLVDSVDSSVTAIEMTNENIRLNELSAGIHRSFCMDAFAFLRDIKNKYDVIVLDPPAFAKHQRALSNALQAYKRINQLALEQLRPGGILFTFSCSQVVSRENFRKSVFAAAANAQRNVEILHQLTQPPDHPVSIYHPEGEYLKGLVLFVE
ncbi:MAG: class I SAM-dependent rRNA methyltransferase [Bacteroidales bacterium]|nr:class I SAM-dependent rRNA methyltransferase [Bacteroidales bacterium]